MADSLLTSLYGLLDTRSVSGIADSMGASDHSVSQGFRSAIAAILGGMAGKSEDSSSLRTLLDLAPIQTGDNILAQAARVASDPNSPLITGGKHLLSTLFGNSQNVVMNSVGAASGLRTNATSTVMAVAAPMVMSFIAHRVRAEGLNMRGFGNLLQRESDGIRGALPSDLRDLFFQPTGRSASPVIAQAVEQERSSLRWLPLLALLLLVPALMWLFSHLRSVSVPAVVPPPAVSKAVDTANRAVTDSVDTVKRALLSVTDLRFDTGSAKLRPESEEQLNVIATTLTSYPDVHLTLTGHTDNVGDSSSNAQLSKRRAETVMAELIRKGVPADHLSAEGGGDQDPISENSTEEGRAKNRRVSMDFSQH